MNANILIGTDKENLEKVMALIDANNLGGAVYKRLADRKRRAGKKKAKPAKKAAPKKAKRFHAEDTGAGIIVNP